MLKCKEDDEDLYWESSESIEVTKKKSSSSDNANKMGIAF